MEETIIALAGNPNVGKSTVFNYMTGLKQHTGNWTGKTVENAFGSFQYRDQSFTVYDLPGTYSILSNSPEEEIARNFICFGDSGRNIKPDITVAVADACLLERNLNLFLQISEITDNVILCLNLTDEAEKRGIKIDTAKLARLLQCPVVKTSARNGEGMQELYEQIYNIRAEKEKKAKKPLVVYSEDTEDKIAKISALLDTDEKTKRFAAIRILENDTDIAKRFSNEDTALLLQETAKENREIRDEIAETLVRESERIANACVKRSENSYEEKILKADKILTSGITGKLAMIFLLCLILWITVSGANYPSALLSSLFNTFEEKILYPFLTRTPLPEMIVSAIVFGIYRTTAWVVSVMLPPMAIFFPLFTFLEDIGYLPRIAFNLDKYFRKCGTSGRQSLTVCMGLGCNACGVTGCRIISSEKERLIAVMTNALTPCNGRFPTIITVIAMFLTAFMGSFAGIGSALIMTLTICFSLACTLLMSKFLSHFLKEENSSFIMELPPYRKPQIGKILVRSLLDRTLFVLGRAVSVAAPAGLIIWIFANVHVGDGTILSCATAFLQPLGKLMGMDGTLLLGFILGFPANEIVLPIALMGYTATGAMSEITNTAVLKDILISNGWTIKTAICTIIFVLIHFPCATTLLTIKKETKSLKYTAISFLLPTIVGMALCIAVNFILSFFIA